MMIGWGTCSLNVALLVLLVLLVKLRCAHAYGPGPGDIYPTTAELAVGGSVNITCRMNPSFFPGRNASDLRFINAHTNKTVPSSDMAILNATSIVYMLRDATEQSTMYLCVSGPDAVMYMKLYVGRLPGDVHDFRCRNYDYEYMVCNFTQPRNHVLTQYNLTYYLHSQKYTYNMHCNYDAKPLVVCNTTLTDKSRTHFGYFQLKFLLTAGNALGKHKQTFNLNASEITVPTTTGEKLHVWNLTTDTLEVGWTMPKYDLYSARGLQWHIVVQPWGHESIDFSANAIVERRDHRQLMLRLTGLPYAYYDYTLHVRARVRTSTSGTDGDDDDLWSTPFVFDFRSEARLPDRPPRTDVGSFYIYSSEMHVRIYWEQLQPFEYNGDQFHYVVNVQKNGLNISLEPLQIELNSAKFEWQKGSHYRYEIRSRNHVGVSEQFSAIEIPIQNTKNQRTHSPPAVHNVYHATNNSYTLTWLAPTESADLLDYTIFWCSSKRAMQTECQGSIYFEHVESSARNFTTPAQPVQQEHTLNFAVSANYMDYNTGMHWTPCTMDGSSDLVTMEPEVQATSATSISVQWMLERICLSVISGYRITYCELLVANDTGCVAGSQRTVDLNKNLKRYTLTGLRPYTSYQVQMLMYSTLKESILSEPLVVRTQEAASSPPRQLQRTKVTRDSAIISWLPPLEANGQIRHYTIKYNEQHIRFNVSADDPVGTNERFEYELQNLTSYTHYRVHVCAHTVASSLPSNELSLYTLIGVPSMPGETFVMQDKDSSIQWSRPAVPAGRLEYYELAVTQFSDETMVRRRISIIVGATSCHLAIPGCIDEKQRLVFDVRAINAALLTHEVNEYDDVIERDAPESAAYYQGNEDLKCSGGDKHDLNLERYNDPQLHRLFYSEWRRGPTYGCSVNPFDKSIVYIIVLSFVMMLLVMALMYVARKKIIKMSNIECTLPPGLATYLTKDGAVAGMMQSDSNAVGRSYGHAYADSHHQLQHVQNEKHHLLSAAGNDSGYLGDNHTLERHVGVSASNGCLRTISESSSADSMIDSNGSSSMEHELDELDVNGTSLTPTSLATSSFHNALPRITEEYVSNAIAGSTGNNHHTNGGGSGAYVIPTKILNWKDASDAELQPLARQQQPQPQQPQPQPPLQPFSDYVTVSNLENITANNYGVNGYVQPSQLPKLFNTPSTISTMAPPTTVASPLESYAALTKTQQQQQQQHQQLQPTAISGYVTQRELNQFNQQQCN